MCKVQASLCTIQRFRKQLESNRGLTRSRNKAPGVWGQCRPGAGVGAVEQGPAEIDATSIRKIFNSNDIDCCHIYENYHVCNSWASLSCLQQQLQIGVALQPPCSCPAAHSYISDIMYSRIHHQTCVASSDCLCRCLPKCASMYQLQLVSADDSAESSANSGHAVQVPPVHASRMQCCHTTIPSQYHNVTFWVLRPGKKRQQQCSVWHWRLFSSETKSRVYLHHNNQQQTTASRPSPARQYQSPSDQHPIHHQPQNCSCTTKCTHVTHICLGHASRCSV
jgi:hypothetical protein